MIVSAKPFKFEFRKRNDIVLKESFFEIPPHFYQNGRKAMLAVVKVLGLKNGDGLLVPAYFCSPSLEPLRQYGIKIVFIDIDTDLSVPLHRIERVREKHSIKALILPQYFGFVSQNLKKVCEWAEGHEIRVVLDWCHSFLPVSFQYGDAHVFSIRKTLPVRDGGAYVIKKQASRQSPLAARSITADFFELFSLTVNYFICRLGWPNIYGGYFEKWRTRPINNKVQLVSPDLTNTFSQGAISSRLMWYLKNTELLSRISERRRENYLRLSASLQSVGLYPIRDIGEVDVPQVFPLQDESGELVAYLRKKGIGAYRWPDRELPEEVFKCPHQYKTAIQMNKTICCLPIHQDIGEEDFKYIVSALTDWIRK